MKLHCLRGIHISLGNLSNSSSNFKPIKRGGGIDRGRGKDEIESKLKPKQEK